MNMYSFDVFFADGTCLRVIAFNKVEAKIKAQAMKINRAEDYEVSSVWKVKP